MSDAKKSRKPAMFMRWEELLFIHWVLPVERVQRLVPEELVVEEWPAGSGQAWVGLVPFTMPVVRFVGCPGIPTMRSFHECNVRTYVRPRGDGIRGETQGEKRGGAGVWFFSLDAHSRLAVIGARRVWGLNYHYARIALHREANLTRYAVERMGKQGGHMRCWWEFDELEEAREAEAGSVEEFVTNKLCLYAMKGKGKKRRLMRGDIAHEPWRLRSAKIVRLEDELVRAEGMEVDVKKPALVMAAAGLDVNAWGLVKAGEESVD